MCCAITTEKGIALKVAQFGTNKSDLRLKNEESYHFSERETLSKQCVKIQATRLIEGPDARTKLVVEKKQVE